VPVDAAALQHLYTLPPEEFVAARTALAKELRAVKDRETAAEVTKLRRPSVVDWALNVVARDHADLVGAYVGAAAAMRDAQAAAVEGRRGGDVRDAVRDLRTSTQPVLAAVEDVVTASGRAAGSQTAALTARLAEVAGNEAAAEQLRAGRLGSAELDAVDPFAGLEPPHRSAGGRAATDRADANRDVAKRSSARSSARRAAERAGEPPTAGGRGSGRGAAGPDAQDAEAAPGRSHVSAADRAAAKQALVAARKERAAARSELTTAQRVLDRAEATAAKAAAELAEARERVATAQQRAVDAERRWTAAFQRGAQNVPR
jgi:hypothetical protein